MGVALKWGTLGKCLPSLFFSFSLLFSSFLPSSLFLFPSHSHQSALEQSVTYIYTHTRVRTSTLAQTKRTQRSVTSTHSLVSRRSSWHPRQSYHPRPFELHCHAHWVTAIKRHWKGFVSSGIRRDGDKRDRGRERGGESKCETTRKTTEHTPTKKVRQSHPSLPPSPSPSPVLHFCHLSTTNILSLRSSHGSLQERSEEAGEKCRGMGKEA